MQLILAVDVSGSIDAEEFAYQTNGMAQAFENESLTTVIEALDGGVLVTMTHWSGVSRQRQMIGWHHVTDAAGAAGFAAAVRGAGRAWRNFSTAIGEAVAHAHAVGFDAPVSCARKVIDISGDGVSNEGRPPYPASAAAAAEGYTVNALVIRGAIPDPVEHYATEVIAGPGAFVEIAEGYEDYPRAILRKLLREIDDRLLVSATERAATPSR
ncbi:MAG: DUF1194 domain-containing protein [Pseudomonadota bacterium]